MQQAANLERDVREIIRRRVPKPRPAILVCVNGQIIADAMVVVSDRDPNWWRGMAVCRDGLIEVRAPRPKWRRL